MQSDKHSLGEQTRQWIEWLLLVDVCLPPWRAISAMLATSKTSLASKSSSFGSSTTSLSARLVAVCQNLYVVFLFLFFSSFYFRIFHIGFRGFESPGRLAVVKFSTHLGSDCVALATQLHLSSLPYRFDADFLRAFSSFVASSVPVKGILTAPPVQRIQKLAASFALDGCLVRFVHA